MRQRDERVACCVRCNVGYRKMRCASVFIAKIYITTFNTKAAGGKRQRCTFISWDSFFSAREAKATLNFGTLGVDTCLWNSGTSIALVKTCRSNLTAAFREGSGSFFLTWKKVYMRKNIYTIRSVYGLINSEGSPSPMVEHIPS